MKVAGFKSIPTGTNKFTHKKGHYFRDCHPKAMNQFKEIIKAAEAQLEINIAHALAHRQLKNLHDQLDIFIHIRKSANNLSPKEISLIDVLNEKLITLNKTLQESKTNSKYDPHEELIALKKFIEDACKEINKYKFFSKKSEITSHLKKILTEEKERAKSPNYGVVDHFSTESEESFLFSKSVHWK